jgi:hypothetical protein
VKNYSKAIAGFLAAAVVAFLGAKDGGVTSAEWLQILLAGLGGSGLVFIAPRNTSKSVGEGRRAAGLDHRGQSTLLYVLAVVVLVLLILWLVGAFHR